MKRKLQVLTAVLVAAGCITAVAAAASSPSVTTGAVTGRTQTTAVLHGSVNPNGRATTYVFQYGLTTAYGVSTASHSAGSKSAAVAVRGTAVKLIPGTVYHYRLVAAQPLGHLGRRAIAHSRPPGRRLPRWPPARRPTCLVHGGDRHRGDQPQPRGHHLGVPVRPHHRLHESDDRHDACLRAAFPYRSPRC